MQYQDVTPSAVFHIPNIKKQTAQTWRTDRYDRLMRISLTLFRKSVCCCFNAICYAIFMMIIRTINQVQVWMSYDVKCLPKRIRGGRLPSTLDALSLDLRRLLIFFRQYLFNIFSELFHFIYQKYKIKYQKFLYK